MNGNKFSNLKDTHCKMALAFLERPRWTPATAWQTPTPQSPSANGFTTAGAGQYDKDATPTADVHPEDRQEILIFFLPIFWYFSAKAIQRLHFCPVSSTLTYCTTASFTSSCSRNRAAVSLFWDLLCPQRLLCDPKTRRHFPLDQKYSQLG